MSRERKRTGDRFYFFFVYKSVLAQLASRVGRIDLIH